VGDAVDIEPAPGAASILAIGLTGKGNEHLARGPCVLLRSRVCPQ
jgi:hypothetical protein